MIINTSCGKVKQVDKILKKSFGQVNRLQRKKSNYSKRLGLGGKEKNDSTKGNDNIELNTIDQKNMINEYGYLFEMINGVDPGKIINNPEA